MTAGNPELDPFRADAYDLAFEWYFADEALLSVALFHKDIESFVQTMRETHAVLDQHARPARQRRASRPAAPRRAAARLSDWHFSTAGQHGRRRAERLRDQTTSSRSASCRRRSTTSA